MAENPAAVKVFTKVRTFCSAQPSSFETTTLKAFARRGDAARSKAVQRMVKMDEAIEVPRERRCLEVAVDCLYMQWHHALYLYTRID